jgi:uncharacterized protein YigE (DUF2233 family)
MRRLFLAILTALMLPKAAGAVLVQPCGPRDFEGARFTVCPFHAGRAELRLTQSPTRSFAGLKPALGVRADKVLFAMNAGMFDEAGAPVGLSVEDGIPRHALNTGDGDGNFYLKPNGVLWQGADGALHVETTQTYYLRNPAPRWATQSGPMLVVDGKLGPGIASDGQSRNIRNAVGLRDPGTAIFAISEEPVSFGKLARFLREAMGCPNALYLDGAVSGLWLPSQRRMDHRAPLGPMVVVSRKD